MEYWLFARDDQGQDRIVKIFNEESEDAALAHASGYACGHKIHNVAVMKKIAVVNEYNPLYPGKRI
ncbi:MAG: hypothetical protein HYT12_00690 [Candidatus Liptonbacteria bacterium]|nr:hypothetical protein [Candidatus Liptonbacteria bacterium]